MEATADTRKMPALPVICIFAIMGNRLLSGAGTGITRKAQVCFG